MGFLPSDAVVARATGMGMECSAWAGSGCYITGRLLDTYLTCFFCFLNFSSVWSRSVTAVLLLLLLLTQTFSGLQEVEKCVGFNFRLYLFCMNNFAIMLEF